MNLKKISDSIVFNSLKNISYGNIKFINYDGSIICLGARNTEKTATLKINKPGLTFEIINKGSIGLAESYMRGDFETDNLTNLIEIAAKNINKIHKFSGALDFPIINFFKSFFIKNTKKKSKENIAKHYDLGNEFFSLWLDKTLTYSSAIFDDTQNNLENAVIQISDGKLKFQNVIHEHLDKFSMSGYTKTKVTETKEEEKKTPTKNADLIVEEKQVRSLSVEDEKAAKSKEEKQIAKVEKAADDAKVTMRHFEDAIKKVREQKDLKIGQKVELSAFR